MKVRYPPAWAVARSSGIRTVYTGARSSCSRRRLQRSSESHRLIHVSCRGSDGIHYVEGIAGKATIVGREWLGWRGVIAHPNSPAGGGGPGHFVQPSLAQLHTATTPSPWAPGPLRATPLAGAPAPRPPNLPPHTNPGSLGIQKSVKTDLMDVQVDAKIVADGNGGDRPKTGFTHSHNRIRWPQYQADAHDKIVRLIGKVIWHDTITIQTVYPAGARPDQPSNDCR